MEPSEIPFAMVEAAARVRALQSRQDFDRPITSPPDDPEAAEYARNFYRENARALLAAALSVCEAREDWGYIEHWSEYDSDWISKKDAVQWTPAEVTARRVVGGFNVRNVRRSLIRRWVFTTPAELVPDNGGEK